MKYIVIDADIIDSRQKNINKHNFKTQIEKLNETFEADTLIPFSMYKGDEIQGVVRIEAPVFNVIRYLKALFLPYELRIGVGIGPIYEETPVSNSSWDMNGEAFFYARDAMDLMKESKGKKDFLYYVYFKTGNDKFDMRFNLIYSYINDFISKWKVDIFDIIFLEEEGLIHQDIARIILEKEMKLAKISDEEISKMRINVTKKIQRSNWYKIKQTEGMLDEMLREELM